jgi:hypothetical protein
MSDKTTAQASSTNSLTMEAPKEYDEKKLPDVSGLKGASG